jgi:hypothetical protein
MVDAGRNEDCSERDQRGFAVSDGSCDIGAVERGAAPAPGGSIFRSGFED